MKAIKVRNLKKSYQGHEAVRGITFEVEEGELFAFLGENGAGKSTTINILCTILQKTEGEVEIFNNILGKNDDEIRNQIGIVFQNSVLDDKLTVKENILTRGSYYGFNKAQIMDSIKDIWEAFKLDEIWNKRYEKLSGGQRRRVDIVRALINRPKILFLDEPTTGLDPMSRKIVWDYIDYLRREKKLTIFLTTHYMEETKDADHVVILDKGKIVAEGTPGGLKSKYAKNRFVWYEGNSIENQDVLKGLDTTYDTDHFTLFYDEQIMPDITEFIYKNKDRIKDYEIIKGTMDDVFLNLTGKELSHE